MKITVGLRCMAPVKDEGRGRREYEEVLVEGVTDDGHVVSVITQRPRRMNVRLSFSACSLKPLGTPTPMAGAVL